MATPPSTDNYQVGGAIVVLGGVDLGNVVSLSIDPSDVTILDHFTARSGARKIDKRVVTQKRMTFTVELDEHATATYKEYFMGSLSGSDVHILTNPLSEKTLYVKYLNESTTIWTYSHTKAVARPSASMDFGNFDDWVTLELEIEALEDASQTPWTLGRFISLA